MSSAPHADTASRRPSGAPGAPKCRGKAQGLLRAVYSDAYFRTPRATIRQFLDLLAVLEHNPDQIWQHLLGGLQITQETNPDLAPHPVPDPADAPDTDQNGPAQPCGNGEGELTTVAAVEDDLASFRLTAPAP